MKCIKRVLKTVRWTQYFAACTATIGGFALGTILGWSSPSLPSLEETHQIGALNSASKSWIGSFLAIGAIAAGPLTGFAVERFGRKASLLALSAPFFLGWILIATARTLPAIYAGRILTGFGGGGYSLAAPVFIAETASENSRGTQVSLFQLMICLGKLFIYVLGEFASSSELAFICSSVPVIYVLLLTLIPESPWYLIGKGKTEEAKEALSWLRGTSNGTDESDYRMSVKEELENIEKSIYACNQEALSPSYHLMSHIFQPIIIMMGLALLSQFCGINALTFYALEIFRKGGDFLNPNMATVIIGVVQVLTAIPASYLVDRCGRKLLLVVSFVIMHVSLVALGVYFYLENVTPDFSKDYGWIPTVSSIFFYIGFSIGIGPCVFVIMREILPNAILGFATAMVTTVNWTSAFVVTKCFENFKDEIGDESCFGFFAVCCALGVFFVLIFVPETKGKSLCDTQKLFK